MERQNQLLTVMDTDCLISVDTKQRVPILPIVIGNVAVPACNARDLYAYLHSKQDFSTWIKFRISKYGFIENQDFVKIDESLKNGALKSITYGQQKIEYYLTVDMAKQIGMVEHNLKGRELRRYFIKMEAIAESTTNLSRLEWLKLVVQAEKDNLLLEGK